MYQTHLAGVAFGHLLSQTDVPLGGGSSRHPACHRGRHLAARLGVFDLATVQTTIPPLTRLAHNSVTLVEFYRISSKIGKVLVKFW